MKKKILMISMFLMMILVFMPKESLATVTQTSGPKYNIRKYNSAADTQFNYSVSFSTTAPTITTVKIYEAYAYWYGSIDPDTTDNHDLELKTTVNVNNKNYTYTIADTVPMNYVQQVQFVFTESTGATQKLNIFYGVPSNAQPVSEPTLTVSPTSATVNKGATTTLTYSYNGDGAVTVSSSNTGVATATVNTSTKKVTVTAVAAGSATITIHANGSKNYAYKSVTASITVPSQQTGYVTLDANKSVTYGTTSTTFNIKTNHGGTLSVSDDNATATVSRNGTTVTISNIGSLSVGTTVKVTVSCAATSSYTAASAVFSLTFTKATGYVTLDANKSVAYKTASTTFAVKTNHGGTLTVSDDNSTAGSSISGTTVTVNNLGGLNAGTTIKITVKCAATTNYNEKSAVFTLTISKATGYVTLDANKSVAYKTASTTFAVKTNHGGTLTVSDDNSTAGSSINGTTVTVNNLGGLNAGTTIKITVKCAATTNYNEKSAVFTLTISKATGYVTLDADKSVAYKTASTTFAVKTNHGGTLTVSDDNSTAGSSINGTTVTVNNLGGLNAGTTIKITVKCAATTNYNEKTAVFTLTISKATGYVTLDANKSVPYKTASTTFAVKTNHGGTLTVSDDNGTATCSINGTTVTVSNIGGLSVGTTVKVTVKCAATTNYTEKSATFSLTFSKIAGYVTLDANKSVPYKTASTTFAVKTNHGGTLTVSDDNNTAGSSISGTTVTVNNIGGLNVGTTVKVTVKCAATTNYNEASATFSLTFSKINGSGSVTMANWTYGGTASSPSPTSSTNGTGSVTYSYKVQSAADSTYSGTKPSNAGSYTVRAVFAATTNYNAVTATANFTINRAGIARPTFADKKYTGASQSISAGTGYSLSGTTSGTNVNTYTATATPDANHQWSSGSNVTSGTSVSWKIVQRPITITTKAQTVETVDKVSQATSNVTVGGDGIVSGQSLTSIKLTGSTSTGKISASNAVIKSGNTDVTSQYAITYSNTGNLTCTKTAYVVRHYQMNLDGTNYTLKDTDNLTGTSGANVTPGVKTYTGFTAPSTQTVTIKLDGTTVVDYRYTRNKYYLDLNGWLDGASSGNITNYGTANVYVNGTKVGNAVADYYAQHYYGSTYKIENVGAASGKVYKGVHSGSLEGTIGAANVSVFLEYKTQYSISCEDWFVDSSNNRKVLIPGTNATKTYEHGDTARGSAWGTGNNGSYRYHADTSVTVTSNATVYRYYYVWVDVNIFNPSGVQDYQSAYFSLSNDGTNWDTNLTNESAKSNNLPWGTVLTIKDLTPYYTYYVYDRCTGCTKSGSQWTYTVTGPNSMSIYMKYNSYTVTFNFNEGTTKSTSSVSQVNTSQAITETYNSKYTLPATNPFRPGYTFNGWYTATSGGTKITTDTTVTITAAQTLYAQWTVKTYTLTVNPNSGTWSGSTNNQSFTQNYGTTKTIANPTKTGYTFKGWVLTKTIDSANYVELMYQAPGKAGFGGTTGAQKANTVYLYSQLGQLANFKYNDKYDFIIAADENGKMYKWSQTSNPLTTTAVTGYSNTSNGMGGLVYNNTSTLLAVSTASNNWWNAIGMYGTGTNPIANADNLWTNQPVHFYVKAANDLSNLSTYTITGALNDSNNYIFRDENVTLMAIWQANTYQVAYNANTGTGSMSTDTATYDQNYTTKANSFSKEGYTFIGWNEKADGTGSDWTNWIGRPWKWTYTKSITLYAQWKINTYTDIIEHWTWGYQNAEGNNGAKTAYKLDQTSFDLNYASKKTLTASDAVTIPNGFYLKNAYRTSSISANGSEESYNLGTEFTQKAKVMTFMYDYYPTEYVITYDLDGGRNNTNNPSKYTVLYGVTFADPVKPGYTFLGWFDKTTGNQITGINEGANATFSSATDLRNKVGARRAENVEIIAHWSINDYTVSFYNNDGIHGDTLIERKTYTYGTKITVPENPERYATEIGEEGYTINRFSYWNPEKLTTISYENAMPINDDNRDNIKMIDSDIKYTAIYVPTNYTNKNATVVLKENSEVSGVSKGIQNDEGLVVVGKDVPEAQKPIIKGEIGIENNNGLVLWYKGTMQGPMVGRRVEK